MPLVDVRTAEEYRLAHVPGAQSVPLAELDTPEMGRYLTAVRYGTDRPLCLTSDDGVRAAQAAAALERYGLTRVVVLAGGNRGWQEAGLPLAGSRRVPLTLAQQALAGAGLLVALKVVFGYAVDPVFFALAAGVGIGIAIAALTRSTLPQRLVARLPWNRVREGAATIVS
jgi:rhodanese-related sulfurtransferase